MINELFANTAFGVALTLVAYEIGKYIQRKTGIKLLSPLITGTILIIGLLLLLDIDYNNYKLGGDIVSFFIAPATVSFAIPLYKNIKEIRKNLLLILVGITGGLITGLVVTIVLCEVFGVSDIVTISMLPKSVTGAIGFSISEMIGGVPEITLVLISIQGTMGYIVGEKIFRVLKIENPIIRGIALGTNSHVVGTAKAMELGETEGAMSSAAIPMAGVIMVFLVYVLMKIFI
ncbi:MAG: LrgB family protein [Tissierellia bacterium]|nr:LrgB family protein [Tissierellia bacterium]